MRLRKESKEYVGGYKMNHTDFKNLVEQFYASNAAMQRCHRCNDSEGYKKAKKEFESIVSTLEKLHGKRIIKVKKGFGKVGKKLYGNPRNWLNITKVGKPPFKYLINTQREGILLGYTETLPQAQELACELSDLYNQTLEIREV